MELVDSMRENTTLAHGVPLQAVVDQAVVKHLVTEVASVLTEVDDKLCEGLVADAQVRLELRANLYHQGKRRQSLYAGEGLVHGGGR